MSEAEKEAFGAYAQNYVRTWTDKYRSSPWTHFGTIPEFSDDALLVRYNSRGGRELGPMTTIGLSPRLTEKVRGVRSQASLQFVLRTPSAFAFGPTWIGYLVSNVQASLLWTMRSGESYNWSNPGIGSLAVSRARGPIATITDLSVEKVLNARGRFRPSAFLEIRNLFNQMDDTDSGEDYMRWGLQMSPPDSPVYQKYGDETIVTEMPRIRDYKKIAGGHRFAHPPRRWSVGVRVVF